MNKVTTGLLSLALVAGTLGSTALASADSHEDGEHERPEKPPLEKSFELLDNGAQITLTYTGEEDFSEFVEKFQERHTEHEARRAERQAERGDDEERPDIDHSVEIGEDSIVITITSDDADAIERIQERAEEGPRKGPRRGGRSQHQRAN